MRSALFWAGRQPMAEATFTGHCFGAISYDCGSLILKHRTGVNRHQSVTGVPRSVTTLTLLVALFSTNCIGLPLTVVTAGTLLPAARQQT